MTQLPDVFEELYTDVMTKSKRARDNHNPSDELFYSGQGAGIVKCIVAEKKYFEELETRERQRGIDVLTTWIDEARDAKQEWRAEYLELLVKEIVQNAKVQSS